MHTIKIIGNNHIFFLLRSVLDFQFFSYHFSFSCFGTFYVTINNSTTTQNICSTSDTFHAVQNIGGKMVSNKKGKNY